MKKNNKTLLSAVISSAIMVTFATTPVNAQTPSTAIIIALADDAAGFQEGSPEADETKAKHTSKHKAKKMTAPAPAEAPPAPAPAEAAPAPAK